MKQFFRRVIDKKARAIDPPVTNVAAQKQALLDKHDFNAYIPGNVWIKRR